MVNRSGSSASNLQQIGQGFRFTGWICLWFQVVLTVVSSVVLIFAALFSPSRFSNPNNPSSSSFSTFAGVALTTVGILALCFSIYWAFRYVVIGRQLVNKTTRPKKAEVIQILRTGLYVSLGGMLVAIFGAEAITGVLVGKASVSQGSGFAINPSQVVQSLDMFTVLANIQVILAHFVGIAAALLLLNKMSRQ